MTHEITIEGAYTILRQAVAELTLISHVSGISYEGKVAKDTTEDIGGNKPPGTDQEFKPRGPGADATEHQIAEYEAELDAWLCCYHRKTPLWFSEQADRRQHNPQAILALAEECRDVTAAWKRTPMPAGGEPHSRADQHWKRWVGLVLADPTSGWDVTRIVNRYGCSRSYVNQVRKAMHDGALMPVSDDKDRKEREREQAKKRGLISVPWRDQAA